MAKSAILFTTLLLLTVWIDYNDSSAVVRIPRGSDTINYNVPRVRQTRSSPSTFFSKIIELWNAFVNINYLYTQQKNESNWALQKTYDILVDGFSDTATRRIQVWPVTTTPEPNGTTDTTTERYRISRKELGYILGKNYRGLKKLFNIELNDALNQSKYTIAEYKEEHGNAVAQYTVPKEFPEPSKS